MRVALRVDELQGVDRVANGAQFVDETHALGDVPAGAEEIHHVAVGRQCRLALDHQRLEPLLLQQNGECEPGDAAAGDEYVASIHARRVR